MKQENNDGFGIIGEKSLSSAYVRGTEGGIYKKYYETDYRELVKSLREEISSYNISAGDREELVKVLRGYNASGGDAVEANLNRIESSKCYTVMTGQQPGLLGGPLYTVYKALTVLKVCKELNEHFAGEYIFVPVFWIASEDHDVEEVNRLDYQEGEEVRTLKLGLGEVVLGKSLERVKILEELQNFLKELRGNILKSESEFTKGLEEELLRRLRSPRVDTFGKQFKEVLKMLFSGYGLLLVEPYTLRKIQKEDTKQALIKKEEITKRFRELTNELKGSGYKVQIKEREDAGGREGLPLYYLGGDGRRKRLFYKGDKYYIGGQQIGEEELHKLLDKESDKFSHGVQLRSVLQDKLFPNVAVVCGPGEINYIGQLKGIYELYKVKMPIIYPRARVLLLSSELKRITKRFGLREDELKDREVLERRLNAIRKERVDISSFEKAVNVLNVGLKDIERLLSLEGQDIKEGLNKGLKKLTNEILSLESSYRKKKEEKAGLLGVHASRLKVGIHPRGRGQERVYNIFWYMNKHKGLIDYLYKELDIKKEGEQIIYL